LRSWVPLADAKGGVADIDEARGGWVLWTGDWVVGTSTRHSNEALSITVTGKIREPQVGIK
jgi:hypothetical protein